MSRILRWTVPVDGYGHTIMAGRIVHVATRSEDAVEFWADDFAAQPRHFVTVGTGHDLPADSVHVGSAVTPSGQYVWHLLELVSA